MAVNTRYKRASAMALVLPFLFTVSTDATLAVDSEERWAATWMYSGIAIGESARRTTSISGVETISGDYHVIIGVGIDHTDINAGTGEDHTYIDQNVTKGAFPQFEGVITDEVRAIDGDGLKLYDDDGNGIFVEDGGQVGIGTVTPGNTLEVN
jgi:hypothetical protein